MDKIKKFLFVFVAVFVCTKLTDGVFEAIDVYRCEDEAVVCYWLQGYRKGGASCFLRNGGVISDYDYLYKGFKNGR